MESRFLLTKKGCPFCRDLIRVVKKINFNLPIEKRIKIIDCYEFEDFGLQNILLMPIFEREGFNYYPFLYIDGAIIEPAPTPEQLFIALKTLLNKELLLN